MSDPTFLKQFVGIYDLPSTQLTIVLKNETTLTATFQGGQDYALVPYQGTEFNVQGESHFSIEFKPDEQQTMQAVIIQPGFVFIAKKRSCH